MDPQFQENVVEYSGPERREDGKRWHVGREIPLALIVVLIVQTAGGVWWAANLTNKVDSAILSIQEFKTERYTKDDARRDQELMRTVISVLQTVDSSFDRRINLIEQQHAALINNGMKR